jgi:hypothetical protein
MVYIVEALDESISSGCIYIPILIFRFTSAGNGKKNVTRFTRRSSAFVLRIHSTFSSIKDSFPSLSVNEEFVASALKIH